MQNFLALKFGPFAFDTCLVLTVRTGLWERLIVSQLMYSAGRAGGEDPIAVSPEAAG